MDATALSTLVILALIDSTSFGTLLIPIWLLTAPGRPRVGRMLVYLGTVTLSYLSLGVALLFGADAFLDTHGDVLDSPTFLIGQLVLGAGLIVVSQAMDTRKARARAAERAATGGGRLLRWRGRILSDANAGSAALVGIALASVGIEAASMLPYLAALGIITAQGLEWQASVGLLLGYCIVMIVPALALMTGRVFAHNAFERPLGTLEGWLTKHATGTTAWIIGIVGFLLGAHAVFGLGWVGV